MCGVAGILRLTAAGDPPAWTELRRMAAAMLHRGPDELGLYRGPRVGLVHTRLSIIDLASGQQPMANEDDSLWIVFNGEIFNYVELREELHALGHRFRTASDTEVIVHAYEAWGEDAFARFNGQFAVALWDEKRERLVLARDRLGVRPLHYLTHEGRLFFASEVKAIFAADPSIPRALDPHGLDEAFTFWAPLAPRTPFAGVSEVRPGHVRVIDKNGDANERAYAPPRFPTSPSETFAGSLDEATERVRAALDEATKLRVLRADVPVGSYLSGGLDSSLVAALAIGRRQGKLATFSLRFEDAEYDETSFQRAMAERLESDHHELVVSRGDIARAFPRVVAHAEKPLLRTAPAPLFLLSGLVHDAGIKVVLTGEGADEMFAGYDLFREAKVRRYWAKQPASTRRPELLQRLYPYLARSPVAQRAMAQKFFGRGLEHAHSPTFAHETRWQSAAALKRLFSKAAREAIGARDAVAELVADLPPDFAAWTPLARDQHLEIRTLLSSYILCSQGDRMLMAHSVEGRFPFLDVNVAALAASLPPAYKLKVLDEKHVLKRAARDLVLPDIVSRKKQPYRAPDALSFVGGGEAWIEDALSPTRVAAVGIFDPAMVQTLWKKLRERKDDAQFSNADNMALVGVLSTQLLGSEILGAPLPDETALVFKTVVDRVRDASKGSA